MRGEYNRLSLTRPLLVLTSQVFFGKYIIHDTQVLRTGRRIRPWPGGISWCALYKSHIEIWQLMRFLCVGLRIYAAAIFPQ